MYRSLVLSFVLGAAFVAPAPLQAQSVSGSLQVGAVVPVVCETSLSEVSDGAVRADLRCNAPHRVTLSFTGPSGLAEMSYRGLTRTVSPAARTVSWEGDGVLNTSEPVRLRDGARADQLRVTVEPR